MDHSLEQMQATLRNLQAREDIRTVLYRYCRAVDRGDKELLKSCYHPDGRDDHSFFSGLGWDLADYVIPILAQLELSIHSLSNPMIDLQGDRAFVETHWSVIHRIKRGWKLTDMCDQGRYLDEFECRNGEWKILNRVMVIDAERWVDTVNLLNLFPADMQNKAYSGIRGTMDPVYRLHKIGELVRPKYSMSDLWSPYRKLLAIPKFVIYLLGKYIQSRPTKQT
jgi:hypothetical protein